MPTYSGSWALPAQMQAIADGTWTGIPQYELYSWGLNTNGQLGLNDRVARSSPVQVGTDKTWLKVSISANSSGNAVIAIKTDGTLWGWGNNTNGQLGTNDVTLRSSPVQIGALTNWLSASVGGSMHVLALKTDGTLWTWGKNNAGQLGQSDKVYRSSPVQIGALTTWNYVATSFSGSFALKTDGTLWSWGDNSNGQLGQNDLVYRSSPIQVGALTNWSKVSSSTVSVLAIKTDGTLWSWGQNNYGELGLNDVISRSSPVQIGAATDWSNAQLATAFALATKTNNTLWAWGTNSYGVLGQNDLIYRSSPVQVGALTTWSIIGPGQNTSMAIKTDGTLWGWGRSSDNGQLNNNDRINRSSPVQIGTSSDWVFAQSQAFTVGIRRSFTN